MPDYDLYLGDRKGAAGMAHRLIEAMANIHEAETLTIVNEMLATGEDPAAVLDLCSKAMKIVGDRYQNGTYFLPELIMSGEMLRKITEEVKPRLVSKLDSLTKLGTVVLGTVRGDIHDIGKDIVGFMLSVNGFEVVDLGIDQPEEAFVEAVRAHDAQILALSGFLSVAFDSMRSTVEQIKAAGLRDDLRVIIGGGQIDDAVREHAGADAYGRDAMDAVAFEKATMGVS